MDCDEIKKNLSFYIEGAYEGEHEAAIHQHLATCADCRQAMEKEKIFLTFLRGNLRASPAPMHVRTKVQALLQAQRKMPPKQRRNWCWMIPSAMASIVILVSLFVYTNSTSMDWMVSEHVAMRSNPRSLEIQTDNPSILNEWVSRKTGKPFHLATFIPAETKLQGGRVVSNKNGYIVQVIFTTDQGVSSLYAMPKGYINTNALSVALRSEVFYPQKIAGNFIVSWSGADGSYALVSESEQGINQGCVLCHANEKVKLPPSSFVI